MVVFNNTVRRSTLNNNNGTTSSSGKPKSAAKLFFLTLVGVAALLSGLAVHLSHQLIVQSRHDDSRRHNDGERKVYRAMNEAVNLNNALSAVSGFSHVQDGSNNGSNNGSNYPNDRVYCMIPFIWNEEMYHTIMSTWGKRCDSIYFLTDAVVGGKLKGDKITDDPDGGYLHYTAFPPGTFPENVVFINMTRSWNDCYETNKRRGGEKEKKVCRHIWEKMWRSWVYVDEHHSDRAEWFCKVDYDTFFFPDNLKYFVHDYKQWDPYNEHHYFGHVIQHRQSGRQPMVAGATACWSRKTLKEIAQVYRDMPKGSTSGERGKCEDRAHATEEVTTSLCLKEHLDVDAFPARDDQLREFVTIAKIKEVLTWNRTEQGEWWFWKGKPEGAGEMEECCAVRPIGLHKYKMTDEILEMENQFFGERDNLDYKKLNARTKRYVDKVRRAMGIDRQGDK